MTTTQPEHGIDCEKETCGYYRTVLNEGGVTHGSSGAGMVDDDLGAVVGVVGGGTGNAVCPTDYTVDSGDRYIMFGSLARAWLNGMHRAFAGKKDEPMSASYELVSPPVPTLLIGNIAPTVFVSGGPTRISIR